MKQTKLISYAIGTTLLGVFMLAMTTSVWAGIATTRHNLGSTGTFTVTYSNTTEICVFCHTPHGSDTTATVPLWNRDLSSPPAYQIYNIANTQSLSLDGETEDVGSVSLACLSCHDGQTAMDTLINEPGSGTDVAGFSGGVWGGGTGSPTGIRNLGLDLTNDHPIGAQYGGGGITITLPGAATNDPDFTAPESALVNGQTVWWVDSPVGSATVREKTDMILYNRVATTSGVIEPYVECASCHDPHSNNATFLRLPNTNSQLCLTCHTK